MSSEHRIEDIEYASGYEKMYGVSDSISKAFRVEFAHTTTALEGNKLSLAEMTPPFSSWSSSWKTRSSASALLNCRVSADCPSASVDCLKP